jgi:hypothetical protein
MQSSSALYGIAIIIMLVVLTGMVCILGDLPIPYISQLYAPQALPATVLVNSNSTVHTVPIVSSSTEASSSAMLIEHRAFHHA